MKKRRERRRQVSQEILEALIGNLNSLREIRRRLDAQKEAVLGDLLAGIEVEPGVHTAEIVEEVKPGERIQRLDVW